MAAQVLWALGPTEESSGRRRRGIRKSGGKKGRVTPAPLFIPRGCGRGHGGSVPLPRPFLRASPRGGTSWGGGSCNRATMPVMAMMASSNHTMNRHLM
jgi:hypothetical protein